MITPSIFIRLYGTFELYFAALCQFQGYQTLAEGGEAPFIFFVFRWKVDESRTSVCWEGVKYSRGVKGRGG